GECGGGGLEMVCVPAMTRVRIRRRPLSHRHLSTLGEEPVMFRTVLIAATLAGGIGAPPALAQGDAEAGEALFNRHCRACHQIGEDARNSTGPVLTGVVGEEIASNPDFRYSPAFLEKKEEGFVWTEETLAEYLA